MLLSHDAAIFAYGLEIASGENLWDDYTYISRVFLPRLRAEAGVTEEDIAPDARDQPAARPGVRRLTSSRHR